MRRQLNFGHNSVKECKHRRLSYQNYLFLKKKKIMSPKCVRDTKAICQTLTLKATTTVCKL